MMTCDYFFMIFQEILLINYLIALKMIEDSFRMILKSYSDLTRMWIRVRVGRG